MAKVLTFSTTFPGYHPKAGQSTLFIEKLWESLYPKHAGTGYLHKLMLLGFEVGLHGIHRPKHHTIREGNRFKAGDYFSPRIWGNDINPKSGKSGPYNSKQIIIAPDIYIPKVYDFEIKKTPFREGIVNINQYPPSVNLKEIAENDGLEYEDFLAWFRFPKCFSGQIICWNENINYDS